MYELTTLHPFVEGNKRTGFMCADTLLVLNDLLLITTPEAHTKVSLEVAKLKMERDELIDWFKAHTFEVATF